MNWTQFFLDYSIPYQLKSDRVLCNCPHHAPADVDYFMRVYPTGATTCWMCGGHSAYDTIQNLIKCNRNEAQDIFKQYSDTKHYVTPKVTYKDVSIQLPIGMNKYELLYLHGRLITDEQIKMYDLRGGGIFDDYWKYRIIIPIYRKGEIVNARGRTYVDDTIRYKGLPEALERVPIKHTLYAHDLVIGDSIVVMEGELDAIRFGPPAVATYGTKFVEEQVRPLTKYRNVYILFDMDSAGILSAQRLADWISLLSPSTNVVVVSWKDGPKDIGKLTDEQIKELRRMVLE